MPVPYRNCSGCCCAVLKKSEQSNRARKRGDAPFPGPVWLFIGFFRRFHSANTKGGYGVRNINERLHLAYGPPYGLYCESTPGAGTRVAVLIPAVEPP